MSEQEAPCLSEASERERTETNQKYKLEISDEDADFDDAQDRPYDQQ